MNVTVNGKIHVLDGAISIQALTEKLGLNLRQVAVERNLEIVPRSTYGEVMLSDGDRIEIVHFIGGG